MERVTIVLESSEDLTTEISTHQDSPASYNVTVNYYITQEEMIMLAESQIGQKAKNCQSIQKKLTFLRNKLFYEQ